MSAHDPDFQFFYTNHRGERFLRHVRPIRSAFLAEPGYGYEPGFFLIAYDYDREAERQFLWSRMEPVPGQISSCLDMEA